MKAQKLKILRMPAVLELTGLSRPTVERWVRAGRFPAPLKLGERAIGWRLDEIERWLNSRTAK